MESMLESIRKEGYFFAKSFFSPEEVELIKKELLGHYDKIPDNCSLYDGHKQDPNTYPYGKSMRFSSSEYIPVFKSIFQSKNLSSIVSDYLGRGCRQMMQIFSSYEYITEQEAGEKPRNAVWHFDPYKSLKLLIYLEDTNEDNGCFQLVPQTKIITDEFRKTMSLEEIAKDGYNVEHLMAEYQGKIVKCEGERGSMVAFDSDTFHVGSNIQKRGMKRMVIIVHNRPLGW